MLFCENHDLVWEIISVSEKRTKNCIVKIINNVFEKNDEGGLFPLNKFQQLYYPAKMPIFTFQPATAQWSCALYVHSHISLDHTIHTLIFRGLPWPCRLFSGYLHFNPHRDQNKSSVEFHQLAARAVDVWNNCSAARSDDDCSTDRNVIGSFGVSAAADDPVCVTVSAHSSTVCSSQIVQ